MTKTIHPWTVDAAVTSPFAFPEGLSGYLAGLFMRLSYDDREVAALLEATREDRVLEVGFGPGALLHRLSAQGIRTLAGVDPSERMLRDATRRNRRAIAAGRMALRHGTAQATGYPDASFDRIISVHNVALWPSLEFGLDELRRVLHPGGMLLLAWHGGRTNPRSTRHLRLSDDKLARIERELSTRFARVERLAATRDDVFRAFAD